MENKVLTNINDAAYQKLIDNITALWSESKAKAITAVNTELLDANWQTGKYIVEFELKGKDRAEYGKQLLVNLAKDLTARNGKGFSRSNLVYMRKFYLAFPICETVIIRKTKRFAFFERTAHFFRTKRTSEGYPPISKIFRLAHASIILKRRWNFIPTPFVFRFVASLRFTRFRRSLCTLPRFARPRFYRGRRDATRCSCPYSTSR